jgi:hypothetical protein
MSFNDISPMRQAFRAIPHKTLNTSMRTLLLIIASYPEGCYIGREALAKECGFGELSTLKSNINKCLKLKLLDREQKYPRDGLQQCYRVNMKNLMTLSGVSLNSPSIMGRVDLKPSEGLSEMPSGVTEIAPYKDNKQYKSSNEDLFNTSLSFIPASSRFSIPKELNSLLEDLEHRGTTLEAIRGDFSQVNWNLIDNPKAFVLGRLRDLMARPVQYTATNRPPKCANPDCDEKTRTLPYLVSVPNGNGQTTQSCLECNHYWVNKRNGF